MSTIQQMMQTGPVKANEIFTKLVDTSAAAVRGRDRLVSDLKVELERQAEFEEKRLFPVLREHRETKDLAARALKDGEQMRNLFGEIERTPKDSEAFVTKVTEFRDMFQRRFRDDKNDILPAVIKVLRDAQTGTADGMTGITPARRADGGEHPMREAARQGTEIMKAGMDAVQQGAQLARRAMGARTDPAPERQRGPQSAPAPEDTQDTARRAAFVGSSMMALFNEQARHALQAQTAMAAGRVRTLAEVAQVQSAFMVGSFQRMGQFNDRYRAAIRGWKAFPSFPSARR